MQDAESELRRTPLPSGSVNRACGVTSRSQPIYASVSSTWDAPSPSRTWYLNSGNFVFWNLHARAHHREDRGQWVAETYSAVARRAALVRRGVVPVALALAAVYLNVERTRLVLGPWSLSRRARRLAQPLCAVPPYPPNRRAVGGGAGLERLRPASYANRQVGSLLAGAWVVAAILVVVVYGPAHLSRKRHRQEEWGREMRSPRALRLGSLSPPPRELGGELPDD